MAEPTDEAPSSERSPVTAPMTATAMAERYPRALIAGAGVAVLLLLVTVALTVGRGGGHAGAAAKKGADGGASAAGSPSVAAADEAASADGKKGKPATAKADIDLDPLAADSDDSDEAPKAAAELPGEIPDTYRRAEVLAAIAPLQPLVEACYGDELGVSWLKMTIASTGKVIGAIVGGAFADSPIGECVSQAARTAVFRPTKREITTVFWPFGRRPPDKAGKHAAAPPVPAGSPPGDDNAPPLEP